MAKTSLPSSEESSVLPTADRAKTVEVEVEAREQDTAVSADLVASIAPLQPTPTRPKEISKSSISTLKNNPAESNSKVPTVLSFEQTVISADLEAQFDGLFIATPPISPRSKPVLYLQRSQPPKVAFPVRKYTLPTPSDKISDLAHILHGVSLDPGHPDEWRQLEIKHALVILATRIYITGRQKPNPFPGIDMNFGWNRARYACDESVSGAEHSGLTWSEEKKRACERLKGWTFWTQMKPIELDDEQFGKMFEKVFVGNGSMQREPGTWWAAPKPIFKAWRGKPFLKLVMIKFLEIGARTVEWKINSLETISNSLKRKASDSLETKGEVHVARKLKTPKGVSEKIMTDEWRARRRLQEKNAGRWTDGTLRMDRMWGEFCWVLNVEDPKEARWTDESKLCIPKRPIPGTWASSIWGSDVWGE